MSYGQTDRAIIEKLMKEIKNLWIYSISRQERKLRIHLQSTLGSDKVRISRYIEEGVGILQRWIVYFRVIFHLNSHDS